jgi:hypothetical protein
MEKEEKAILVIMVILITVLTFSQAKTFQNSALQEHSYTKALCTSSNYCEDYYIQCSGNSITGLTPTGFSITTQNAQVNTNENFCG